MHLPQHQRLQQVLLLPLRPLRRPLPPLLLLGASLSLALVRLPLRRLLAAQRRLPLLLQLLGRQHQQLQQRLHQHQPLPPLPPPPLAPRA